MRTWPEEILTEKVEWKIQTQRQALSKGRAQVSGEFKLPLLLSKDVQLKTWSETEDLVLKEPWVQVLLECPSLVKGYRFSLYNADGENMMGHVLPSKLCPQEQRWCLFSPSCCAFGPNNPHKC